MNNYINKLSGLYNKTKIHYCQIISNHISISKQSRPWSGCSEKSCLIWSYSVCKSVKRCFYEAKFDILTICMVGNISCYHGRLLTFFKINFLKNSTRNTIRVSNHLDPYQDQLFVGSDMGPNSLQRLLADDKVDTTMERVKYPQQYNLSFQRKYEPLHVISNNVAFGKCGLRRACADSF